MRCLGYGVLKDGDIAVFLGCFLNINFTV